MGIPARRFTSLDNETNIAVANFQTIADKGIYNSVLNQNSLIKNNSLKLANGFIKNNLSPDIANVLNLATNLHSIMGVMGKPGLNKILTLAQNSPLISRAINEAIKLSGTIGLNKILDGLIKQVADSSIVSPITNSAIGQSVNANYQSFVNSAGGQVVMDQAKGLFVDPYGNVDLTGALYGVVGVSALLSDIQNMVSGKGKLSNGLLPINRRITQDPSSTIALIGQDPLTSAQSSILLNTLVSINPTVSNAIKVLSPDLRDQVLADVNYTSEANTIKLNGFTTPVSNVTAVNSFINAVNTLSNTINYKPVINNNDLVSSFIVSLSHNSTQLGLPPLFSTLSTEFSTNQPAVINAGSILLNKAATGGDLNNIIDIASNPLITSIVQNVVNIIDKVLANVSLPLNIKEKDISSLTTSLLTALSSIDNNWYSSNSNNISLSKVNNISGDFKKMLSIVNNNINLTIPDLTTTTGVIPPLDTNIVISQWFVIASQLGTEDVLVDINNKFGLLPLTPDTHINKFTVNSPLNINGVQLIDNFHSLTIN